MKSLFKSRTSISAIEVEIENLKKRRAEIVARIENAELSLNQAREERRESLSTDGDFDTLTAKIREFGNQVADLQIVLADIDVQTGLAVNRLSKAGDAEARATSASALEKIAAAAETRVVEIEKAANAFAKAISGLRSDLGEVSLWESHNASRPKGSIDEGKDRATAREVAAGVVAEILAMSMPWAFETFSSRDGYRSNMSRVLDTKSTQFNWAAGLPSDPVSAAEIVKLLVSAPLREQARAIMDATAEVASER